MAKRDWTMSEVNLVAQLFPTTATQELALILGRSYKSVASQAHFMKLRKTKEFYAKQMNRYS